MQIHEKFREVFHYCPTTGRISWKVSRRGRGCVPGREAGSIRSDGRYRTVFLNGKRYYTHRVIWKMVHGPIPKDLCIDHINGNGLDNRIKNLRLVTRSENQRNRAIGRDARLKIQGVYPRGSGYQVQCAGEYITFTKDFFEACCARKSAEAQKGFHPNHGRGRHENQHNTY